MLKVDKQVLAPGDLMEQDGVELKVTLINTLVINELLVAKRRKKPILFLSKDKMNHPR